MLTVLIHGGKSYNYPEAPPLPDFRVQKAFATGIVKLMAKKYLM